MKYVGPVIMLSFNLHKTHLRPRHTFNLHSISIWYLYILTNVFYVSFIFFKYVKLKITCILEGSEKYLARVVGIASLG
jgi:hypothetical protein